MIRQRIEVALFAVGMVLLPLLPRRCVVLLAHGLGSLGYYCSRKQRVLARANIQLAFGKQLSRREQARIAEQSFRTFALLLLDLFWFRRSTASRVERYVVLDESFENLFRTRPAIIVTAHFGNWEALGLAIAREGYPVVSVAAPLANPFVDRALNRLRTSTGQRIIPKEGAVRRLLRELRGGAGTAMLLDQNTLPRDGGVFVPFFGLPVPISRAAVRLAARSGASIVPVFSVPQPDGSYRGYALAPIPVVRDVDEDEMTARLAKMMEQQIRENPGHWLWMYRRWKLVPEGGDREQFPWYARPIRDYELPVDGGRAG